jgi:hypothetical protein
MEMPFSSGGSRPDEAFASAAEQFVEMLKSFGPAAGAGPPDWTSLVAPLASQFEQWMRFWQSAAPGFAATGAAMPGAFPAPSGLPFGMLPLGAAAPHPDEAERPFELLGRLAQLQGQLAAHWREIASSAAQRFVARVGGASAPLGIDGALKLYELWVNCAEEAYAATAHKEDFARLQAELTNIGAALLLEQRRHAETIAHAFGLPTRSEVDALTRELTELRRGLEALTERRPTPAGGAAHPDPIFAGETSPAPRAARARPRKTSSRAGSRRKRRQGPPR